MVETGISIQERIPASVSKAIGPVFNESMLTVPVAESYINAPLSMDTEPTKDEVALYPQVSKERIGTAVVDVAMVQA